MKAGEVVCQDLMNGKIQYRVPMFQRTYSWKEANWQRLWDDLLEIYGLEEPPTHFLGAIVTLPIPDSPEHVNKFMLIDGQQRLTTLFILLAVLKEKASGSPDTIQLSEQIQDECLTNKYAARPEEHDKLEPTQADRSAFKAVLNGESYESDSLIIDACNFFKESLELGDLEGQEIDLSKLKSCITDYLNLVSIRLDTEDSPHRIFESLNNTGMALTASDLVRNYVFMQLSNDEENLNLVYNRYWLPMQRRTDEGEGKSQLSNFFWRFLMRSGELPRYDEVYQGMHDYIDKKCSKGSTVNEIIEELDRFSQHYVKLWKPTVNETSPEIRSQMERIVEWEVEVAYPFLMTILEARDIGKIDEATVVQILKMIESYVVRRTVCGIPTNRLRRVFAKMSGFVEQADDFLTASKEYLLKNDWPKDEAFRQKFLTADIYFQSRLPRTRLFLTSLERSFEHHEPIEINENITIEHVMPQTLSEEWIEELGEDAEQTHATYLHTIGNLTYSGYNSEMGNQPFEYKKKILEQSHFEMNRQIVEAEQWTRTEIEARAEAMADRALLIWPR